ncbi:hypothetical protein IFM60648_05565 [Aspergillus lentulus]|uniref:Glycosyl transferase family protein n=1 Tax=Aspergillus lentulus TaxID=293939 RepID=A0ABQ1AE12_ASPLE|nr:hypothetical protein IFM62136_03553 [Aspergillus lentulus]GFF79784.1 hypothetical protein IFM60648_05565 [Aspergillus lentulus]
MRFSNGASRTIAATKVWATLITNTNYLPGLFTLEYSLRKAGSKYPLVVLYTDSFPAEGHAAVNARGLPKQRVPHLLPTLPKEYTNDPRFHDTWTKLTAFSLVEYERVVLLDSDMLVRQNMDELMDLELDAPELGGRGNRVFAASHACVCNPLKKPHYPKDWIPANCAFTSHHANPDKAQIIGAPSDCGLGLCNSGLLVINPSKGVYDRIIDQLNSPATLNYTFPDQDLLSDVFRGRWVGIPYIYNALKTLRRKGVHDTVWRDDKVKVVHYILSPKPWDEIDGAVEAQGTGKRRSESLDPTHEWWWRVTDERREDEKKSGVADMF